MTRVDDRTPRQPPAGPSADVVDRATRIQELLGGLTVPFAASEIPEGLIRAPERREIEVRRRTATTLKPAGPHLDARSFDILNRMAVAKTHYLKSELGRHFEFVGATGDAVRTPSGRWYFRVTDPRGQKLDILFGAGLRSAAKFMMHAHAGRQGYSDELSPEATLEVARFVSTIRLRPPPKAEIPEFIVDGEDEELPEDREQIAKEGYREEDLTAAKSALKKLVERTPKRLPPLMREIARKDASELAEADLDRMIGTIADQAIMLRSFELDTYDGNTLRLSRTDADGNVALIELMIQEFSDREPGAMLRVAIPPGDGPVREFDPDLANDLQVMDDVDDDLLTPAFEVTSTSLGLALFRFAVDKLAYPPVEVDQHDELLAFVDPEREHIVIDKVEIEDLDDEQRSHLETPLTKTQTRKFRQALNWLDANWDDLVAATVIARSGFHPAYLGSYGKTAPPALAKTTQIMAMLKNDRRLLEQLSDGGWITRDAIQQAIEKQQG